jgi:hypothetical protein
MKHGVDTLWNGSMQRRFIGEVAARKRRRETAEYTEIRTLAVQSRDLPTRRGEVFHEVRTDKAGSTRYERSFPHA